MQLSEHSLRQLEEAYLDALDEAALRALSVKLLEDLKEARDRLNQGPENSSRPPSSRAPWERKSGGRECDEDAEDGEFALEPAQGKPVEAQPVEAQPVEVKPSRKAGTQPGVPGIGRTQVFQAQEEQAHYPEVCAGGSQPLDAAAAVAYTGFQAVDRHWGDGAQPGLTLWVVNHRY